MTVQEKMAQLEAVKADIKQALIDKGIDMTGVPFTGYAEKIAGIKTGVERTYLFKDGELTSGIALDSGLNITNNIIYTNSAGGTSWTINYPFEQGQTFCIKSTCTADAGSPGNESYISTNVAGKTGVIRFPGEGEQNDILTFGILCNSTATSASLYLYTYGKAMGIVEMWIE